jgi:hypothetical protein
VQDARFHQRQAKDVSFLIQHLDIIVKSLDCVNEVFLFQPVPAGQLFKKSISAPKTEKQSQAVSRKFGREYSATRRPIMTVKYSTPIVASTIINIRATLETGTMSLHPTQVSVTKLK